MKNWIVIAALMTLFSACVLQEGDRIPTFDYTDLDGKRVTSASLEGKATVLVVWATWCSDCIREIPELNALKKKYENNPHVAFLAFSDEDESTVRKSLGRYPFDFTHLVDTKEYSDRLKSAKQKHFPQVMVVNKDLQVVYEVTENKQPIFDVLDQKIQKILKPQ